MPGYGRKRRFRSKSRFRRRKSRRVSRVFRKKVQSVMFKTSELKWTTSTVDQLLGDGMGLETFYAVPFPTIAQGAGRNQRIGNRIFIRNFQIKLTMNVASGTSDPLLGYPIWMRMYFVFPKKWSHTEASGHVVATDFPLFTMADHDNWVFWKDTFAFPINPDALTGAGNLLGNSYKTFSINKKFPMGANFVNSADTFPEKMPFLIINATTLVGKTVQVHLLGYVKISYKDI